MQPLLSCWSIIAPFCEELKVSYFKNEGKERERKEEEKEREWKRKRRWREEGETGEEKGSQDDKAKSTN